MSSPVRGELLRMKLRGPAVRTDLYALRHVGVHANVDKLSRVCVRIRKARRERLLISLSVCVCSAKLLPC